MSSSMRGAEMRLGDHLDFSNGSTLRMRESQGRYPIYGANGAIGYAPEHNARGPLIIVGRVGSFCGSVHFCDSDVWITENAVACHVKNPAETRFWYYALQACGLNRHRAGSGQPLLNQSILRSISVRAVEPGERRRIGEILGAIDDKIAANRRVVEAAEQLMVATALRVRDHTALSNLATRSTASLGPREFDDTVALYSLPAFDRDAQVNLVDGRTIRSHKFVLPEPCVLFSKLNPGTPRIWNIPRLPSAMALASTEFVVLRPIGVDTSALWSAVRQPEVSATLHKMAAGMTGSRQRIQPRELLEVTVPDVRGLPAGPARALSSLGALCQRIRAESAHLYEVREVVLPLLIRGKVRVRADGDLPNERELYDKDGLP
ncbi:restriction endonuclease subunit S [Mycobacterium conspicuum]|uniref:restriction endonuclease subunit S n=1 Tax=Mycobacterium conspicuum TaxID=44010 RepID=UPI0035581535